MAEQINSIDLLPLSFAMVFLVLPKLNGKQAQFRAAFEREMAASDARSILDGIGGFFVWGGKFR
jgi:hypothetical protein